MSLTATPRNAFLLSGGCAPSLFLLLGGCTPCPSAITQRFLPHAGDFRRERGTRTLVYPFGCFVICLACFWWRIKLEQDHRGPSCLSISGHRARSPPAGHLASLGIRCVLLSCVSVSLGGFVPREGIDSGALGERHFLGGTSHTMPRWGQAMASRPRPPPGASVAMALGAISLTTDPQKLSSRAPKSL